jgi:hypothetical protein
MANGFIPGVWCYRKQVTRRVTKNNVAKAMSLFSITVNIAKPRNDPGIFSVETKRLNSFRGDLDYREY